LIFSVFVLCADPPRSAHPIRAISLYYNIIYILYTCATTTLDIYIYMYIQNTYIHTHRSRPVRVPYAKFCLPAFYLPLICRLILARSEPSFVRRRKTRSSSANLNLPPGGGATNLWSSSLRGLALRALIKLQRFLDSAKRKR